MYRLSASTPPVPLVKTETEEVAMGVHTTHASKASAIEAAQFRVVVIGARFGGLQAAKE